MNREKYVRAFARFISQVRRDIPQEEIVDGAYSAIEVDESEVVIDENGGMAAVNADAVIQRGWSEMADIWPLIESEMAYAATADFLLQLVERLTLTRGQKLRVLSLGTGPGLYEIFLAWMLRDLGCDPKVISLDYAPGMVQRQRGYLDSGLKIDGSSLRGLKEHVTPREGDMTDLSRYHDQMDVVLAINSLQWSPDWRKSVGEIAAAMSPKGKRFAGLILHPHAMKITSNVGTLDRPLAPPIEIFDELIKVRLLPVNTRIIKGPPGSGQAGRVYRRTAMTTVYRPEIEGRVTMPLQRRLEFAQMHMAL